MLNIIQWNILSLCKIVEGWSVWFLAFQGLFSSIRQKKTKKHPPTKTHKRKKTQHFYLELHTLYCSFGLWFYFFKLYFLVFNLPLMITRLFPLTALVLWKYQQALSFLFAADFFSAVFIHLLRITAQTTLKLCFSVVPLLQNIAGGS